MTVINPVRRFFQHQFNQWLARRMPVQQRITLNRQRIFIFPCGAGFGFLGLMVLLWLVATNYENNIVFALASLLAALFVVAIFHSYANLSGLTLAIVEADAAFAGDKARVVVRLQQQGQRLRDSIVLKFPYSQPVTVALTGTEQDVALYVVARHRGWLDTGRLTVESRYPLGLFRVWTHLLLHCEAVVYPRPVSGQPRQLPQAEGQGQGDGDILAAGNEDFVGIEKYRAGESLSHVAWKQVARSGEMMSKHFADPSLLTRWLDWQAFPGMDREARLSRLCWWLLQISQEQQPYGLRLPGYESPLAHGPTHRDRQLRQLALFEMDVPDRG